MSVRKRTLKNGYCWEFCITIQKQPRKQLKKSGYKTKAEAQEAEREAIEKYKNRYMPLNFEKTIFLKIINIFLEHIEKSNEYSKGTYSNYDGYKRNHLQDFYYLPLSEISPMFIQDWFDRATSTKSPHIINGCRKLCKAAFNFAVQKKLIKENPFLYMQKASEPEVIRKRFSIKELIEITKLCKEEMPEFFCIFCLATFAGARLGEYSAFCVEDINFESQQIEINKQYTRRELKERTKTKKSKRIIDFSYSMGVILKWHIRKYHIFSGFLFKGKDGKPISPNWVNDKFDILLEKYGLPKNYMRVHDLRGQYVDIMHTFKIPVTYISRSVGHARTATTNDIYTRILSEVQCNAKDELEKNIFVNIL